MPQGVSAESSSPDDEHVFDAFISYSRKDKALAAQLSKALEAYRPPKDLAVRQRHLEVFQDEADFTGVEYFASVERHLTASGSLIVLCSPNARRSEYVNDEIRRFGKARGAERIIPVLGSGLPNNEADGRDEEKAFPEALCELMKMPLAINYVGFDPKKDKVNKGAFENAWYTLLANIFGVSRSEIEQRDRRRQARARRVRMAIVGAFVASILIGLVVSLYSWRQAVLARDTALSRELAAHSVRQVQTDVDLSAKLALEALRISRTDQAEAALREALVANRVLAIMSGSAHSDAMSLSPNGKLLLGGGRDGVLRVWRVDTGDLVTELAGHTELIAGVAFSADSGRAATASWDGTARIWDVAGKRLLHVLPHGKAPVDSVQFSPDGASVATADGDGVVRVWDVGQGERRHRIDAHSWGESIVYSTGRVAYSPDGTRLLSSAGATSTATGDPVARLWDADSGELVEELPSSNGVVIASQFSADGTRIFTATDRAGARIWDAASGEPLASFDRHQGLCYVAAFSPDGSVALTADRTSGRLGKVWVWDARTGEPRHELRGLVTAAAFDRAGTLVATGNDHGAAVWDTGSGQLLHDLRGHLGDVTNLAFGTDGATLITTSEDSTGRVWNLRDSGKEFVAAALGGYNAVGPTFSADGRWLIAESGVTTVVWDTSTGAEIASLPSQHAQFDPQGRLLLVDRYVRAPSAETLSAAAQQIGFSALRVSESTLAFSPDGKLALTTNDSNYALSLRDSASRQEVRPLLGHQGRVGGAAFGPDGMWLLTAAEDGSARVWDVATGEPMHQFDLDNRGYDVLLSPDGTLAAVVEDWPTIKLWDTRTWQRVHAFTWPAPPSGGNWAKRAQFSPDGTLLAVGDNSGVLHILDVAARTTRATVDAQRAEVATLAFSSDGRFIVTTGGGDKGARVWEAATGRRLAELGTQSVAGATFRPDGSQIATLGSDGIVRLFNRTRFTPIDELIQLANTRVKRELSDREREIYLHEQPPSN